MKIMSGSETNVCMSSIVIMLLEVLACLHSVNYRTNFNGVVMLIYHVEQGQGTIRVCVVRLIMLFSIFLFANLPV